MDIKIGRRTYKAELLHMENVYQTGLDLNYVVSKTEPSGEKHWGHDTFISNRWLMKIIIIKDFERDIFFNTSSHYVDGIISMGGVVQIEPNMYFGPHESEAVKPDGFPCRPLLCVLMKSTKVIASSP